MSRFRRELNDEQFRAVSTIEGPLLVLAGAGTGKTRVITYRIANLLDSGVDPGDVLAVTFTNKAAREMRERVRSLLGKNPRRLTLCTFHALGVRILRSDAERFGLRANFSIYDTSDQQSLLRSILRDIRGALTSSDIHAVRTAISLAKNRFAEPGDLLDEAADDQELLVARAYSRYDEHLQALNAVDFDDLIRLPVRGIAASEELAARYRSRFRHVMVDEYQDTNGSQYRFIRALIGAERNICVVGDDDQSIYGFRGADMDKILKFERDFPGATVIKLEENYRSTASILDLANAVIAENGERHPKALRSRLGPGDPVEYLGCKDDEAEVSFVVNQIQELHQRESLPYEDMAVLMRSAFQARVFEEKLRLRNVPYTLVGGQSYFDRREIRDTLAYWSVAYNPADDVSLLRIINSPKRGIGPSTIRKLDELARQRGSSLFDALEAAALGEGAFSSPVRKTIEGLAGALRRGHDGLRSVDPAGACRALLDDICYRESLPEIYPDPLTCKSRWAAIDDLLQSLADWQADNPAEPFGSYMEALLLRTRDDDDDGERRGVSLMTLHSAKGLECLAVFLVGLEEDILPHRKSIEQGDRAIEEERRLLYVGITRARRRLFLTGAQLRTVHGAEKPRLPSRFLAEVEDRELYVQNTYNPDAMVSEEKAQMFLEQYRSAVREKESQNGAKKSESESESEFRSRISDL